MQGWEVLEWKGINGAGNAIKTSLIITESTEVTVKFKAKPTTLQLKSLKVHTIDVVDNYVVVEKQKIINKNIEAKFIYGDLTEPEKIDVNIKDGEVNLIKGEKRKVVLQVAKDASGKYDALEWEITVATPTNRELLDTLTVYVSTINAVQHDITDEEKDNIFAAKKHVIEVIGPIARLEIGSRKQKWTSFKINGSALQVRDEIGFQSFWEGDLTLDSIGVIEDIKIEVEKDSEKTQLNLQLKRVEGKVDIPTLNVFVNGDKIQYGDKTKLFDPLLPKEPLIEGYEPTPIEVQWTKDYVKSVIIDGQNVEIKTKKVDAKDIWYASLEISDVAPSGKDIVIMVEPKDEHSSYFNKAKLTFRLNYKGLAPLETFFNINGESYQLKPYSRESDLKSSKNIHSKTPFLNFNISSYTKFTSVNINGIEYKNVIERNNGFVLNERIAFGANSNEDFVVSITPEDSTKFLKTFYKFNARKGSEKEKINPSLYINGISDFPQSTFLDKLESISDPPHLDIYGEKANIKVVFSEYQAIFLINKVEIDGADVQLNEIPGTYLNPTVFVAEKEISIDEITSKEIKILLTPKDINQADSLAWKFSLKKTAKLPQFPNSKIVLFSINDENNFADEFINYLTDGSNPTYKIDENTAKIKIGINKLMTEEQEIKTIKFSLDAGNENEIECSEQAIGWQKFWGAEHTFTLEDGNAHQVKIEIMPKNKTTYSSLVYKFRLQRSGLLPKIPNLKFYLEKLPQNNGYKPNAPLQKEYVELAMQTKEDEIESVEIGKEGNLSASEYETLEDFNKKTIHSYSKFVTLSTNGVYEKFIIKAIPKDKTKYRTTECVFMLAGSSVAQVNAELSGKFNFAGKFEPYVISDVSFYDNKNHEYISDYGATKVRFSAQTISPRAKIKYGFVDSEGKPIAMPGESNADEKEMTVKDASFGMHEAEFNLFRDKPTNLMIYVLAEDGISKDPIKGEYKYTYNPIQLKWDVSLDKTKGEDFRLNAYDKIVVDKSNIKDNKIYVSFAIWKNYEINPQYSYPSYQAKPEKFGPQPESWEDEQWYKTDIDISSLSADQPLEIVIPVLENEIECFVYKVKISL